MTQDNKLEQIVANQQTTAIENRKNMDVVPSRIDQATAAIFRSNPSSLLSKCREYNITLRELESYAHFKEKYNTNLTSIIRLRENGLDVSGISAVLDVREQYKYEAKNSKSNESIMQYQISIRALVDLINSFPEVNADNDTLSYAISKISELHDELYKGEGSIDRTLYGIVSRGKQHGVGFEAAHALVEGDDIQITHQIFEESDDESEYSPRKIKSFFGYGLYDGLNLSQKRRREETDGLMDDLAAESDLQDDLSFE